MIAQHTETPGSANDVHLGCAASKLRNVGALLAVIGIGVAAFVTLGAENGVRHFMHAYLLAFSYALSITLGALFFVLLHHLVRAGWSTTVRRIAELLTAAFPVLFILFLPILGSVMAGKPVLFPWADVQLMHDDHLLHKKIAYLNANFFAVRAAIYFGLWTLLAVYFRKKSIAQDAAPSAELSLSMQRVSAPGMIAFALTTTFAAFDFIMSLTPTWFSTIFGIYFFAGCLVSFFATAILLMVSLQASGRLTAYVTIERFHDLGKFLFAFTFFWGYIAFSQFMLIWYANIPEETEWFLHRLNHGWAYASLALLFGHFIIPFVGLMSRHAKRNRKVLTFWAGYMLLMHWLDLYWLVMPAYDAETPVFGAAELGSTIGFVGVLIACFAHAGRNVSLVAANDPMLSESLSLQNQ